MSSTHFGFQTVDESEKASRVRGVFDSVASKYDVMNDVMSGGLHRAWKAYALMVANLKEGDKAPAGKTDGPKANAQQARQRTARRKTWACSQPFTASPRWCSCT